MIKLLSLGLLFVAGSAVHAQTVNIRGKISNPSGQAVSGAVVEMAIRKLKDTTGSDGMYSLTGTTGIGKRPLPFTEHMALNGSILELILIRSQPVKLEVFDVRGNLLKRELHANAPAGARRWNLSENASPDNMLVVKASVGGQARTFRYLPLVGAGYAAQRPVSEDAPMAAGLAKAAADVDTLTITASGFTTKKVPLSGYDSTVNVSLVPSGDGGGYPLKNPPVASAGCGKPTTITTSTSYRTITSSGDRRQYMITMPPNYDMNKPYRLIYASHGLGGEGSDITRERYYGIQGIAEAAGSTIFVSPSGLGGSWGLKDVPLFDDLLALVKEGACLDESRVFVTGFSFGGMYSYSLSVTRQKTIRAAIGMGPANYNIQIPPKNNAPIAWMQTTGMSDGTTPWVNSEAQKRGAKFIAIEHATNNGCTLPAEIPTWRSGSPVCYDFQGCKAGYPVKACTFNGGHSLMPGASNAVWQFIAQF
jgi:poly(3-hydroxybutyrate) depolymerase